MKPLLHPCYFGSIAQFAVIARTCQLGENSKETSIILEREDNYQKQTYRTRQYIYGANGKLLLNIPVLHQKTGNKKAYKDVEIDLSENWQSLHLKSIESAYQSAPFFEYYYDDIRSVITAKEKLLYNFNVACTRVMLDCLALKPVISFTDSYISTPEDLDDYRYLVDAKTSMPVNFTRYTQVFDDRHGFIPNLSVLDVLFNEGPASLRYLHQLGDKIISLRA